MKLYGFKMWLGFLSVLLGSCLNWFVWSLFGFIYCYKHLLVCLVRLVKNSLGLIYKLFCAYFYKFSKMTY